MEKLKALIEALNSVKGEIELRDGGIKYVEKDAEGKVKSHLFIKLRPVSDEDGVERMNFVARDQE